MPQQELLALVVSALDSLGIEWMITGSVASSLQGEPRSTHDIDLVVSIPPKAVTPLLASFPPPEYLLQEEVVREAMRNRSMFNLLSLYDGEKVDFWIVTDEPFDRSRFSRRRKATIGKLSVMVSTPEDTILAKLRWEKLAGGSEKQFNDAKSVFEVQGGRLDLSYIEKWVVILGVEESWRKIIASAELF